MKTLFLFTLLVSASNLFASLNRTEIKQILDLCKTSEKVQNCFVDNTKDSSDNQVLFVSHICFNQAESEKGSCFITGLNLLLKSNLLKAKFVLDLCSNKKIESYKEACYKNSIEASFEQDIVKIASDCPEKRKLACYESELNKYYEKYEKPGFFQSIGDFIYFNTVGQSYQPEWYRE